MNGRCVALRAMILIQMGIDTCAEVVCGLHSTRSHGVSGGVREATHKSGAENDRVLAGSPVPPP